MHFYKYQGTGNDFVMIDDREERFNIKDTELVNHLCNRRFGIGADGLILLRNHKEHDFEMIYYNSDGNLSSMCGNGGRCIARFAQQLGIIQTQCTFMAVDGLHEASLDENEVALKMKDVDSIEITEEFYFLNTGSPHVVKYLNDISAIDIVKEGRSIRYNDRFRAEGTNINFVSNDLETLRIRTYERGVEDETLSCGTGITAAALSNAVKSKMPKGKYETKLKSEGGNLRVSFEYDGLSSFKNIFLIGPALKSFEGDFGN